MRCWKAAAAVVLVGGLSGATPDSSAPAVDLQIIEFRGTITRVDVVAGEGHPLIEVRNAARETIRVRLAPMRYLMEQNFNPKSDLEVGIKGFKDGNEVVAMTVLLTAEKRSVRLRNENGRPLWAASRQKAKGS